MAENKLLESLLEEMKLFVEYKKEHLRMMFDILEVDLLIRYIEHLKKSNEYRHTKVKEQNEEIRLLKRENKALEDDNEKQCEIMNEQRVIVGNLTKENEQLKKLNKTIEKDYIKIIRTLIDMVSCNVGSCSNCPYYDNCSGVDIESCRTFLKGVYLNE